MTIVEPMRDAQLRNHLEHLVQHGTPHEVVQALAAAPNGADVLSNGFGGPYEDADKRMTFAAYCLRRNRVDIWRAVVEANVTQWRPFGALSSSVARRVNRGQMQVGGTDSTPHQVAVQAASPEGLRFAIECDSSQLGLSQTYGRSHESLLTMAWSRLLLASSFRPLDFSSAGGPGEDTRRAIECCRILLEHQAPWVTTRSGTEFSQGEALLLVCSTPWPSGHEEEVAKLFKDFAAAERFDVSAPMHLAAEQEWSGKRPLHAAAAFLHSGAAQAMLEMGVDERAALPPGHEYATDLLGYVRSFRRDGSEEFAATVTRVLMRRSIERNTSPTAPAAWSRRAARAGL